MSQVVSGVKAKLLDYLPGQIGSNARWSTSFIESLILSADGILREKLETSRGYEEIALTDGESEYSLDQKFISVDRVEFASDGAAYEWTLRPVTLADLDRDNRRWRDNTGTRPEVYTLLSTPGDPTCKIKIYRPISSTSSETIRVLGKTTGLSTSAMSDDVQYRVHVPYVLAILKAREAPQDAIDFLQAHVRGVEEIRSKYMGSYASGRRGYGG